MFVSTLAGPLAVSLGLLLASAPVASGATYYVDVARGTQAGAGTPEAPFHDLKAALALAGPGDTIKLVKQDKPIPLMLLIHDKSGAPGQPIILDGQGNTLTGASPLNPADWTLVQPGLYRNNHLIPSLKIGSKSNDAVTRRFYFLFDGKQQRMGRSSKGRQPPLPPPTSLQPGQWSYDDRTVTFYVAVKPGQTLADAHVEAPIREDGIAVRDDCEHWIVRNFNVTHVWNDGYNIHGHTRDFVFENITATECGDDGISEHQDSEITIHGMTSRRNSTGMCHGDQCVSTSDHLDLEDNYGVNLLLRNGTHTITDSTISAAAASDGAAGIRLANVPVPACPGPLTIKLVRCQVPFPPPAQPNPDGKPPFGVDAGVALVLEDCTVGGEVTRLPGH